MKINRCLTAFGLLVLGDMALCPKADAQTVILCADSSITAGLYGFGAPNDNAVFFRNVLGAGTSVGVVSGDYFPDEPANLNRFYNSLPGVTCRIFSGPLTPAALSSLDMLIVNVPDDAFTASEAAAVRNFLVSGKTLYVLGENSTVPDADAINTDLADVGSQLRLIPTLVDGGTLAATQANHQIVSDPLTAGVGKLSYGGAGISLTSGGQPLFLASSGAPFVTVQRPAASNVPEPGTMMFLVGASISGLMLRRRSRTW